MLLSHDSGLLILTIHRDISEKGFLDIDFIALLFIAVYKLFIVLFDFFFYF